VTPERSFAEWMDRLQKGDQEAYRHVYQTYAHRLIGLARKQLDAAVRKRVDPEDVVQSVFKSFFARHARGNWELDNWEAVWALLASIAWRKCLRQNERAQAQRRDRHREVDSPEAAVEAADNEPTPAQALLLAETVERLFAAFDEGHRPIVAGILQGESAPEIAGKVGCSESKVYRCQRRIRQYLQRWSAPE
jgi:RNA polymerase sigma-70 factor (ECF subfamily)